MSTPRSLPDAAYRRAFEALPDAAFVVELETGRFAWVNEAAAHLYGSTRDALVGAPAAPLLDGAPSSGAVRLRRLDTGAEFTAERVTQVLEWQGRRVLVGLLRDATAREEVQRGLEDNKALLETAFDQSPMAMVVMDPVAGRNLQVNDAFCLMSGYSRDELMDPARAPTQVVREEDRARMLDEVTRTGRLAGTQVALRTKQGAERLVRFWTEFFDVPGGRRVITMAEDVTGRVASEAARLEAQARLEQIASQVPAMLYQFHRAPDGTMSLPYASDHIVQLFEVDAEAIRADPSVSFTRYHPDDVHLVVGGIERSARELSPLQFEVRLVMPSGRVKWVATNSMPERAADGSVTWNGFIADVTDRRLAENELAESERRFQLAIEATRDGLFDWNVVTDESWTSPTYARMLGYEPAELTFNHDAWRGLVHPDDRERVWDQVTRCLEGGQDRYEAEYRLKTKTGEWKWVLSRGRVVERDAKGKGVRMVGTHVDLTDQKRLELELAQSDRLAQLGLLAAGIAHEVNNPLSWMLANLDDVSASVRRLASVAEGTLAALREEGVDVASLVGADEDLVRPGALEDLVATAEGALEGTQRIRHLSRALGAFSRAEQDELEAVDLNLALDTAASMASNELRFRATLVRSLGRVPPVRAVTGRLTQLFLNLLVHAAQSIPEGHADEHRITLRSWAEGGFVFVELMNSAHVLSADQATTLFEPTFSTQQGVGKGLGLAIARNLVTEFDGDVRVDSEAGKGTRVLVRLPAQVPEAPAATPPVASGRARVLVIDDEPALQRTLARTLREHEVVTLGSGAEAQELLGRDRAFDVIFCDVSMPGMSGPELHAWIRSEHPSLAGRVVFLTGGSFDPKLHEAIERSGALHLEKPFDAARLRALVRERSGLG